MSEPSDGVKTFTPREIVGELDRYIVGQNKAKRAVAVALRNRWRRQQVEPPELREEIAPKNIIMIGPTGVGKTEIARRLAKLANAPFIKVEASKFTEVGYVGRDVEAMIRDLVEIAVHLVRKEEVERVEIRAKENAENRLLELLVRSRAPAPVVPAAPAQKGGQMFGPFFVPGGTPSPVQQPSAEQLDELREKLKNGELDDEEIEVDVTDSASPFMQIFGANGMEEMEVNLQSMLGQLPGFKGKTKRRRVKVPQARKVIEKQEADKLIDMDRVHRLAVDRTQQSGIVFLDEIDKVAGRQTANSGPDVSREGVQRDLLPIVEGSTVTTKYGPVKTDHILFIAAGAFHVSEVSDLIPELQGRFPIRVELESLDKGDLIRILTEPQTSLTKQYQALLATEQIALTFSEDAIDALAAYAQEANQRHENIGARRLHTVLEALLEEISFSAPEMSEDRLEIDAAMVKATLSPILDDQDLSKYIL